MIHKTLCVRTRVCERCAALAMRDGNGQAGAVHAVKENAGGCWVRIADAYHANTTFVLFALVSFEARPVPGARDKFLETAKELATVANAESKSIWTLEKGLEFVPGFFMQEN